MPLPKPDMSVTRVRKARAVAFAVGGLLPFAAGCSSTSAANANLPSDSGAHQGASSSGIGSSGTSEDDGQATSEPLDDAGAPAVGSDAEGQEPEGDGASTTPTTDGSTSSSEGGHPTVVTCPTTALKPGDSNGSLSSGGTTRTYILHVPTGYTGAAPIPLVVDYHALSETDTSEKSISGYATLGDTEGFATVFPQGIDDAWNIGPCCTTSRTVDDLGFSRALVQAVQAKVCVDPKRIYAVGYSMGGGMSHYLGCNAADLFAAIAPAAFDLLEASEEPCNPTRPITEIAFRGTADPLVPYDGGASMPPNGLNVTIHFLGAKGTFQKWAQLDGCTGAPGAADSNNCSTYNQCKDGTEVTLCTKVGGGHDPGNAQIGWAMLKAHPMP